MVRPNRPETVAERRAVAIEWALCVLIVAPAVLFIASLHP